MSYCRILIVLIVLSIVSSHAMTTTSDAARDVIERVLGKEGAHNLPLFVIEETTKKHDDDQDVFRLSTKRTKANETQVRIEGSTGVAVASGFYYYMRNYCNGSVTWGTDRSGVQLGALSSRDPLPEIEQEEIVVSSTSEVRYMYNFCTLSYSLAFASEDDWTFQVDWMALHGINMPLGAIGTEYVQTLLYTELGLTKKELDEYFPGPAFLGWNRMSDMDGPWSGPLTRDWQHRRANIAKRTFQKMRALGMTPVRMGFSGHVPCALSRVYPNASLAPRQQWQGFNSSCLLDPTDPLFPELAKAFMNKQTEVFGDWGEGNPLSKERRYYATDQWNEISPSNYDSDYLKSMSQITYDAMKDVDENAVWVMQAWFLVSIAMCRAGEGEAYCNNPWVEENDDEETDVPYPRAAAYLSGVPKGSLLILDLEANKFPVYPYTNKFYGHDFVWCAIHNFGQKPGMFGDLQAMMTGPLEAADRAASNFRGIGLAMEGINNNPVVYELVAEMAWHGKDSGWPFGTLQEWIQGYALSRYGDAHYDANAASAWRRMTSTAVGGVYTSDMGTGASVAGYVNGNCDIYKDLSSSNDLGANPAALTRGHNATNECSTFADLYQSAAASSSLLGRTKTMPTTLRYDLVDAARQCLDNLLWDVSRLFEFEYHRNDLDGVTSVAKSWFDLAQSLDDVLGTDPNFMLGTWIAAARATASNEAEIELLDYNARNQITWWGPHPNPLSGYARKMWSGLVSSLYVSGRWGMTIEAAIAAVADPTNDPFNKTKIAADLDDFESKWQRNASHIFPTRPTGDALSVLEDAYRAYVSTSDIEGYDVLRDADVIENGWNLYDAWVGLPRALAFLCDADPFCVGFNTNGMLKRRVSTLTGFVFDREYQVAWTTGTTLYLKRGA